MTDRGQRLRARIDKLTDQREMYRRNAYRAERRLRRPPDWERIAGRDVNSLRAENEVLRGRIARLQAKNTQLRKSRNVQRERVEIYRTLDARSRAKRRVSSTPPPAENVLLEKAS